MSIPIKEIDICSLSTHSGISVSKSPIPLLSSAFSINASSNSSRVVFSSIVIFILIGTVVVASSRPPLALQDAVIITSADISISPVISGLDCISLNIPEISS